MFSASIARVAIAASMCWHYVSLRRPLMRAAADPALAQWRLLQSVLARNAATTFGREHAFASIHSLADYQRKVPIQDYDTLSTYISRQFDGEAALTIDQPCYCARTSGTTGNYKDIPLTRRGVQQLRHAQKQLALSLWLSSRFLSGSVLGFASPAIEGYLPGGCAYGSVSGSAYRSLPRIIASKFVMPAATFAVTDAEAKYQLYALATLACDNMTGMVAANPSSMLKLARLINQHAETLLQVLHGAPSSWLLPEAQPHVDAIVEQVSAQRLRNLQQQLQTHGELAPATVWPALSTIATWTGGSCGIALQQLLPLLPAATRVVEYGYGASEFMGSVNVDTTHNYCLPQLTHHVYEFVERGDWEAADEAVGGVVSGVVGSAAEARPAEQHQFLGPHELQEGAEYYVFVTTQSGLYRYHINDIVRAGPRVRGCASIAFLQKGRGVTNITGEKLSEYQLIQAVATASSRLSLTVESYLALADEAAFCYHLYIDMPNAEQAQALGAEVERELCQLNIEYRDKRASGRLQALQSKLMVPGAGETIKGWYIARGVREAQYKPPVLEYARDWSDRLGSLEFKR